MHTWADKDVLALTQLILIEATRDTTFDVSFNFQAQASPLCQFHGYIDCLLYQRYGGEEHGIEDLNEHTAAGGTDDMGVGFPLLPIFFPQVTKAAANETFDREEFPITQIASAGLWSLEQMSAVDPTIQYVRCLHTDGHRWKLYEVHKTHLKKTKFFEPRPQSRVATQRLSRFTRQPRFFDDDEHMLSVIGMIRFAMGIRENIVLKSDSYEVQELPRGLDPTRTIQ